MTLLVSGPPYIQVLPIDGAKRSAQVSAPVPEDVDEDGSTHYRRGDGVREAREPCSRLHVLSTRLKKLEQAGIIERQVAPAPQRGIRYAPTSAGHDLEPAVPTLGRWGASQLGDPRPGEIVTPESVTMNFRGAFNQDAATGLTASWEIRCPRHGATRRRHRREIRSKCRPGPRSA
jgi:HxlR-like helix-turn-helix